MAIAQFFLKNTGFPVMLLLLGCHVVSFLGSSSGVVLALFVFKLVLGQEWLVAASALWVSLAPGAGLGNWTPRHPGSPAHAHGTGAAPLQRGRGCSLGVLRFFPFGSSVQHIFVCFLVFLLELIYNVVLASAAQQNESVTHIHICTHSQLLFPYTFLQNIESSSLCYAVGPYQLSIL